MEAPDSQREAPSRSGPRYPLLVAATALVIGLLGLYPHLRFSLDSRSLEYFFYSYDEGFYNTLALQFFPGRLVSPLAIRALIAVCGGDVEVALIVADFVFPFLAAAVAGLLAARVARSIPGRLALLLFLLFGAEYVTYLFRHWIPHWAALVWGPGRRFVVEAQPILFLFRTPEPQISWPIAFAFLAVLIGLYKAGADRPAPAGAAAFLGLGALLGLGHSPVIAACVVFSTLAGAACLWTRRWRLAALLVAGGLLPVVVLLALFLVFPPPPTATSVFATSLPAFSPLVLVTLGVLALWCVRLAAGRGRSAGERLGLVAALAPVCWMNQQLVSGLAVAFKVWEENANHIFVALGVAWLVATASIGAERAASGRGALAGEPPRRRARHLPALLLSAALLLFAGRRQVEVATWFHQVNAEEAAAAQLLDDNYSAIGPESRVVFDDPAMSQRLPIRSRKAYRPVPDFDRIYIGPVARLEVDPERTGAASPHAADLYEFMFHNERTPRELEELLREEARQHATLLVFFFSQQDAWGPHTAWRARRDDELLARIPEIVEAYREYRRAARATPGPPVFRVTTSPPGALADSRDFAYQLVDRRPTVDARMLYLYRQTTRARAAG